MFSTQKVSDSLLGPFSRLILTEILKEPLNLKQPAYRPFVGIELQNYYIRIWGIFLTLSLF